MFATSPNLLTRQRRFSGRRTVGRIFLRMMFLWISLPVLFSSGAFSADLADLSPAVEAPKPKPTRFIRVLRDEKGVPRKLQTAVVRYRISHHGKPVRVDLVGAVHVGDKIYYQALNRRFETYEVVLYELVAPKGTRIGRDERKDSTFARLVKNLLKLESQIQQIDYTKKNFVHADMSPKEMAAAMKKRGQTGFSLFFTIFSEMMQQQNRRLNTLKKQGRKVPAIGLGTLLFDPNRSVKLKRYMAEEFDTDDPSGSLGSTLNVMLVQDRNKAALKVLDAQLKKGRKKIAIFYGAAHMPDFEKRLKKEYGAERQTVEWITAWNITK